MFFTIKINNHQTFLYKSVRIVILLPKIIFSLLRNKRNYIKMLYNKKSSYKGAFKHEMQTYGELN